MEGGSRRLRGGSGAPDFSALRVYDVVEGWRLSEEGRLGEADTERLSGGAEARSGAGERGLRKTGGSSRTISQEFMPIPRGEVRAGVGGQGASRRWGDS